MARRRRPPRPGALADLAPLRILTQIVALQACYYAVALVLIVFTTIVAGQHPSPGLLFDWQNLRGDVTTGWTLGLCWMMDSLITVIPILLLIARSKLVLDFALTIHFINLVITSLYTRAIPVNLYWWLLQTCSAGLMVSLGVWACRWRELKPFAFGGHGKDKAADANGQLESGEGDGAGHIMGQGRGRGRDGAGTYEMVGMGGHSKPA
ncbi:integral membrane protein S linking to the trans Golgi network-domain-containing protein [Neohortaea acidophila]|uniref:Integral membrane protein S linking to the trans Golgi network-domain-containing protein n=1 Tax=Neohortaea acidophila TaxID=245834 RepID=A0A6A6PPL8_9PEZI|nr:integral membrane protein S linking to the trans Golgi network-domain-containing protein [Neohortaea acidophila]KAF2481962.1 integral membrane protein S linking to the trans Golgi network-domain-containing protein [Neohortaea acidophila]